MPTDTSDSVQTACAGTAGGTGEEMIASACAADAAPLPAHSLKFRGTLFGSTLSRVFTVVDRAEVGEVISVSTNDP